MLLPSKASILPDDFKVSSNTVSSLKLRLKVLRESYICCICGYSKFIICSGVKGTAGSKPIPVMLSGYAVANRLSAD